LTQLQRRLSEPDSAPPAMARLNRILGFSELRRGAAIFHFPIQALTLWDFHVVFALDRWRQATGPRVRGWLAALGELDALGRTTGAAATITREMLNTGTAAARNIRPAGFVGGSANHARGHLISRLLGGSGRDPRNLTTLYQNPVNTPVMRGFEQQVANAVRGGQTVRYEAVPIYRGSELIPRGVTLRATGDRGFRLHVTVLNRVP
jgi:hypothetical protein